MTALDGNRAWRIDVVVAGESDAVLQKLYVERSGPVKAT